MLPGGLDGIGKVGSQHVQISISPGVRWEQRERQGTVRRRSQKYPTFVIQRVTFGFEKKKATLKKEKMAGQGAKRRNQDHGWHGMAAPMDWFEMEDAADGMGWMGWVDGDGWKGRGDGGPH